MKHYGTSGEPRSEEVPSCITDDCDAIGSRPGTIACRNPIVQRTLNRTLHRSMRSTKSRGRVNEQNIIGQREIDGDPPHAKNRINRTALRVHEGVKEHAHQGAALSKSPAAQNGLDQFLFKRKRLGRGTSVWLSNQDVTQFSITSKRDLQLS